MKKKIIISVFAAILIMAISFTARSMILASIAYVECYGCGACVDIGEPFILDDDNSAWFNVPQTVEDPAKLLRFYAYPAAEFHQNIIDAADACPSRCIFIEY